MNITNERDWAAKTALRLHIWQESLAADDPSVRGVAVWEYLANALAELSETDEEFRINSLRALDEEFPFYQERIVLNNASREEHASRPSLAESENVEQHSGGRPSAQTLVKGLVEVAMKLSAEEKESITRQLAEAGLVSKSPDSKADDTVVKPNDLPVLVPEFKEEISRLIKTVEKIQATLGPAHFKTSKGVNLIRSMQMLGLLTEQFLQLHPQAWTMWEKIVTNHQYTTSFHKPSLAPAESIALFLQGAPATKRADVGQMVAKTFYLALAAVSAVETAGKEFAAWFFDKFGPQNIESIVQYESQGSQTTAEDYWKRYLHLSETYSSDELSEQFLNLLGRNMLRVIQARKTQQ